MTQRQLPGRTRRPGSKFSSNKSGDFDKSPAGVRRAKQAVLNRLALGENVKVAMSYVDRSLDTYKTWRADDKDFAEQATNARKSAMKKTSTPSSALTPNKSAVIQTNDRAYYGTREWTFVEFRKEFLGMETYPHMQEWAELLDNFADSEILRVAEQEGRLQRGSDKRLIINEPPFHGKTATISMSYILYRICMNVNIRVILVSKTVDLAKKILFAIKQRLTDPRWSKLQAEFAPPGGFNPPGGDNVWRADAIYVAGSSSGEKDPTVQAVGIGGSIYGARTDLTILDDISDLTNAHQFDKQIDYIEQDLASRGKGAKIVAVGTRTGRRDVYVELADPHRYITGKSPWTRLKQPAVKQYAEDPKDWVTLWPKTHHPLDANQDEGPDADGLYTAWDGEALSFVRSSMSPWRWALIYQQEDSVEDTVFKAEAVWGSVDRRRKPGVMQETAWGGAGVSRAKLWKIAAMDPAMAGITATMVMSLDRVTRNRWIENAWAKEKPSAQYIREHIFSVTDTYGIDEWVIERNAFQLFLTQDPQITKFLQSRGVLLRPHYSGSNKQDPDFGVASLEPLFGSLEREVEGGKFKHNKDNLLQLPDPDMSDGIRKFIEQLLTWEPHVKGKDLEQDLVMAAWFCEIAARDKLGGRDPRNPSADNTNLQVQTRFMMNRRRGQLRVIG
jgi:hypothetical protein